MNRYRPFWNHFNQARGLHWPVVLLLACVFVLTGCAHREPVRGKVVVLTGASSGFGKGVALKLADKGANLVLAARRTELLESLARECQARGVTAIPVTTDVAHEQDVARLAMTAVERFGRIDVWINNAGVAATGLFGDIPLADHERVVDVNLNGVMYGSYHAMRQFRNQHSGTLINVSSVLGKVAMPYQSSYVATKHAVVGLGASLHQELRLTGEKQIKVSTILPYAADTPFWAHSANYSGHRPRMLWLDPPEKVVNTIVAAVERPRKEIPVGYKAKGACIAKKWAPRITDNVAGNIFHRQLMEKAPAAPPHSGNLHDPMSAGTGVEGGVRERMKAEDKLRRRQ